jgi:lipopolysaccharide transport system permease protein
MLSRPGMNGAVDRDRAGAPGPGGASPAPAPHPAERTTILPPRGWQVVDFRELWRFRELIFFLIWRDVKVRYKQTLLGAAWAILQPLMMMVVFTIFFSRLAGVDSGDVPYPLFAFAGLLPWTFFTNAVTQAGQSVVTNQNLITKVYFPRLIVPVGAVGAGVVDFVIAFGMLLAMMAWAAFSGSGGGIAPGWGLLVLPVVLLGLLLAALGVGFLLSALTVAYRDFRYVVPFMMQLWMFATPSIYLDADHYSGAGWRAWLPLNPVYGLISNFRHAMLGGTIDAASLACSVAVSALLFVTGCWYFRRVERNFADII